MFLDTEWKNLIQITNTIYRKKTLPSLSSYILEQLFELLNASFVEFAFGGPCKKNVPQLRDTSVLSIYDRKFEEDFEREYENTYCAMDYLNWVFFSTESLVYRESDLINYNIREKSKFYQHYLKRYGLIHGAGIVICRNEELLASIALYNNHQRGDFTDKDLQILNQLLPPLQLTIEHIIDSSDNAKPSELNDSSYILKNKYSLTRREIEVLSCIFNGLSNTEVSELLNIAPNTVKKHLNNIFQKVQVSSRTQLMNFLIQNELTDSFR